MDYTHVVNIIIQQEWKIGDLFLKMDIVECLCISENGEQSRRYTMHTHIYDALHDIGSRLADYEGKSYWDDTCEWIARKQRDMAALAQILERNVV